MLLINSFAEAFGEGLREGLAKGLGLIFLVVYYIIFAAIFLFGDLLIGVYKLIKKKHYGTLSRVYTHFVTLALFLASIYILFIFSGGNIVTLLLARYLNLWILLLIPLLIALIFSIAVEVKGVNRKAPTKKK